MTQTTRVAGVRVLELGWIYDQVVLARYRRQRGEGLMQHPHHLSEKVVALAQEAAHL